MEEEFNPYTAGQAHPTYVDSSASIAVTPLALGAILKTNFWVRLVGFVMIGILALSVGSMFLEGKGEDMMVGPGSGFSNVMLLISLIFFITYIIMAIRLFQYSGAIQKLRLSGDTDDLLLVMKAQTKFWKLAGILMLVTIAMYVFGVVSFFMLISRF